MGRMVGVVVGPDGPLVGGKEGVVRLREEE